MGEYGKAMANEAGKRNQNYITAWNHFKTYVHGAPVKSKAKTPQARPGTLAMTEEFRGEFKDWLERVPKIAPEAAARYSSGVDRMMNAVVGEAMKVKDQAEGRNFAVDYGKAMEKEVGKRNRMYKTAWNHFKTYVNNAPVKPRPRQAAQGSVPPASNNSRSSSSSEWESGEDSGWDWESDGSNTE